MRGTAYVGFSFIVTSIVLVIVLPTEYIFPQGHMKSAPIWAKTLFYIYIILDGVSGAAPPTRALLGAALASQPSHAARVGSATATKYGSKGSVAPHSSSLGRAT